MHAVYCFSVTAEAAPGSLARVLDVFSLYGQLPSQLFSQRHGAGGQDLVVEAQIDAMTAETAAAVARRLSRVVGVQGVLYSAKRSAEPARWAA
jgi:hypothetical protein